MTCTDCGQPRNHHGAARGLCVVCYRHHLLDGTHIDYPRSRRIRADVIEDVQILTAEGYTRKQIADRLGMPYDSLKRALWRERKANR